jgi:osmotically-inducible protein OsmY
MVMALVLALGCANTDQSETAEADNTAVNVRDRESEAVTPVDQANNEADLAVTQSIRQAVIADDSLSIAAKNVKIITVGGMVTLRGPVKTEGEKARIEATAKGMPGVVQVDNQLEVAAGGGY